MGKVKYKVFLDTNVLRDVLCPDNKPSSDLEKIWKTTLMQSMLWQKDATPS